MLTDKSIKKCKFLGTNIDHTEGKKTWKTHKQTKKHTNEQKHKQKSRLCNKQNAYVQFLLKAMKKN